MKTQLQKLIVVIGLILVSLVATQAADAANVRKSRTGICHVEGESPYFNRLRHFETYDSVSECLDPDGRSRKGDVYIPKYDRDYFGKSWADMDGDGQNSRAEALIDNSTGPVTFRSSRERVVDTGRWLSLFTGDILRNAGDTDIDHVVPLYFAWYHGAYAWDYEDRIAFANDPRNLIVVENYLNRSKGAKSPIEWLPPENRCEYTLKFIRIMKIYKMKLSTDEQEDFDFIKNEVCGN